MKKTPCEWASLSGTPLRLTAVRRMSKAAKKEVRVADAVSAVVVGVETGCVLEEDRDILGPVAAFDLLAADGGDGHRRFPDGGVETGNLDLTPKDHRFSLEAQYAGCGRDR